MVGSTKGSENSRADAGLFEGTHWSVILRARDKSEAALNVLCGNYRRPLLTWLRIRGYSQHDAEDAVQGFFAHVLNRDFLRNVAREKGSFRTFLLRCLKNHLQDEHDKKTAAKRGAGKSIESLDEMWADGIEPQQRKSGADSPDHEYDRVWAQTVLKNALHRLEIECATQGHSELCAELEPVMFADETALPYLQIANKLGMSEGSVKTAAHRIRNRLRGLVRDEILQTVACELEFEQEVRYLLQIFSR
jgi:RNA polymerase sigma factor (sigma-70 family)